MRRRFGATLAVLTCIASPATASESLRSASTAIGVDDQPARVRITIETFGGAFSDDDVYTSDPAPFSDGTARVQIRRMGVHAQGTTSVRGLTIRTTEASGRVTVQIAAAPHRFKYVAYHVLRGPRRLVVDLWRSAPPVRAAVVRRAQDGCLSLDRYRVSQSSVAAAGREHGLFEHMFLVRLRRADGRVVAQRGVAGRAGKWAARFSYRPLRTQAGTLEAIDTSEGDGSLVCIVQARVRLG